MASNTDDGAATPPPPAVQPPPPPATKLLVVVTAANERQATSARHELDKRRLPTHARTLAVADPAGRQSLVDFLVHLDAVLERRLDARGSDDVAGHA